MTVREYVDARIKGIENDPRFAYEPANVWVNAPLAIEQVDMKARHAELVSIRKLLEVEEAARMPFMLAEDYGGPFSYHPTKVSALEAAGALDDDAEWTVYKPDDNGRLRAVADWTGDG